MCLQAYGCPKGASYVDGDPFFSPATPGGWVDLTALGLLCGQLVGGMQAAAGW